MIDRLLKSFSESLFVWAMLAPFVLYLLLCQKFVQGGIAVNIDTSACYTYTKYFYNNILQGVMPIWEPFVHSGRPLVYWGMLNPFTLLVPFGVLAGLSYYQAYLVFILFYYFLGLLGFYLLAKTILRSRLFAYFSYTALTLSGLGLMVFNQWIILQIFVASVWFFLFLVRFLNNFQRRDFLGLCSSLFIMTISYYPFYLLTLTGVSAFFFSLCYFRQIKPVFKRLAGFIWNNKALVILGMVGLLLSASPLLLYKFRDEAGDMIAPSRHQECSNRNLEKCFQDSAMSFFDVAHMGTLTERVSLGNFFTGFPSYSYLTDDCFYVSVFCLLVILIGAINPVNRPGKILLWIWFVIFLIAIGAGTPVYEYFYDTIFYFKYFRNLFFFMAYLMPIIVLFFAVQLQALVQGSGSRNISKVILITAFHVLFIMFARSHGEVLMTTYLTIAASFLFFTACYSGIKGTERFHKWVLLFLIVLQPIQVFYMYVQDAAKLGFDEPLHAQSTKLQFAYTRPADSRPGTNIIFQLRDYDFESLLKRTDSDGRFIIMPYSVSRWYFTLMMRMGEPAVLNYIRNKFYLYDQWEFYHSQDMDVWDRVRDSLRHESNSVYAFTSGPLTQEGLSAGARGSGAKFEIIDQERPDFKVVAFTVNEVKISYTIDRERFLVYTDNYTNDWKAYIDEDETRVYRTNIAFKGVRLKPGAHELRFVYQPVGGKGIYVLIFGLNLLLVLSVFIVFFKGQKPVSDIDRNPGDAHPSRTDTVLSCAGVLYLILLVIYFQIADMQTIEKSNRDYSGAMKNNYRHLMGP